MRPKSSLVLISIAVVAVAACTGSAAAPSDATAPASDQAAPAPSQVAVVSLSPSVVPASTSPSSSPGVAPSAADVPSPSTADGGAQPAAGAIDPCGLLTSGEASKAIGQKLGAGVSSKVDQDRECTFKAGLTEVKVILAPPAPDAATAQAYWDKARAEVPADVPIKDLTAFDRSAYGSGSAGGASLSALFVIDGTTFFDLYCGFPKCSEAASLAAAQLIVGRLP